MAVLLDKGAGGHVPGVFQVLFKVLADVGEADDEKVKVPVYHGVGPAVDELFAESRDVGEQLVELVKPVADGVLVHGLVDDERGLTEPRDEVLDLCHEDSVGGVDGVCAGQLGDRGGGRSGGGFRDRAGRVGVGGGRGGGGERELLGRVGVLGHVRAVGEYDEDVSDLFFRGLQMSQLECGEHGLAEVLERARVGERGVGRYGAGAHVADDSGVELGLVDPVAPDEDVDRAHDLLDPVERSDQRVVPVGADGLGDAFDRELDGRDEGAEERALAGDREVAQVGDVGVERVEHGEERLGAEDGLDAGAGWVLVEDPGDGGVEGLHGCREERRGRLVVGPEGRRRFVGCCWREREGWCGGKGRVERPEGLADEFFFDGDFGSEKAEGRVEGVVDVAVVSVRGKGGGRGCCKGSGVGCRGRCRSRGIVSRL